MSERIKLFWLGLFIILTVGVLGYLLLLIRPTYGDAETTLRVRFTNVEGMAKGSQVTFAGRPVGEVSDIIEIPDARQEPPNPNGNLYFFELVLKVDSSVKIYTYDQIHFATTGLLGEKSVAITPKATPLGDPAAVNITNEILFGRASDQLSQAINEVVDLSGSVQKTLELSHAMLIENREEFHDTLRSLHATSDALGRLVNRTNELKVIDLLDETLENTNELLVEALESDIIHNLSETTQELQEMASNLNSTQGTLGKLIESDELYKQLYSTLFQTEKVMKDIGRYGLLFQYNKKWQRQNQTGQSCACPCEG